MSAGRGIGHKIYLTVGGYVTGNLLISVIAGVTTTILLLALGVPYAVALGLLVGILDLVPLAGATIAAIIVCTIGFLDSPTVGIILIVFFVLYQQVRKPRPPAPRLQPNGAALAARDPGLRAHRRSDCGGAGRPGRDPGCRNDPGALPGVARRAAPASRLRSGHDLNSLIRVTACGWERRLQWHADAWRSRRTLRSRARVDPAGAWSAREALADPARSCGGR